MNLDLVWAADDAAVAVLMCVDAGRPVVRIATRAGYCDLSVDAAVALFRAMAPPGFDEASAGAVGVVAGGSRRSDVLGAPAAR